MRKVIASEAVKQVKQFKSHRTILFFGVSEFSSNHGKRIRKPGKNG